ncbi:MAG: hypothetical protein ABIJ22_03800 [Patescibacteria group bacterium]
MNFLKTHRHFLFFILFSTAIRLANITDSLFFTWDNGRDFFAVKQIVEGNLTLIGPTSGLHGFFLGPLWFYLGIPGYLLSGASPYGFSIAYILLGLTSLPLFWVISHKLFKNQQLAKLSAYVLSIIPGSIWGTIRVWNPLVSIPLMSGVFLSLLKARESRLYLGLAFFLLGLTLQSEFAYAIFYSVVLFTLIPWIRKKFDIRDFLIAGFSFGSTLLPQIIFEIRHNFIMSNSLLKSMLGNNQENITWAHHFSQRPSQLLMATKDLFIRGGSESIWPALILLLFIIVGFYVAINTNKFSKEKGSLFAWKLIAVLAILPYPFYLVWKGNNGYFFDYYLTSHFIFLAPLLIMGAVKIYHLNKIGKFKFKNYSKYFVVAMIGFFGAYCYQSLYVTTLKPINNAGLKTMDTAVSKIYTWIDVDKQNPGIIRIFTPNTQTEHYDAIVHWRANKMHRNIPITVKNDSDEYWYVLIEPDYQLEKRLNKWYAEVIGGGVRTRVEMVGDLRIESWIKKDFVENK